MSAATERLTWDDVEDAAGSMFRVWQDGAELLWAREAWQHLAASNLTLASTAVERTAASLRLVALANSPT